MIRFNSFDEMMAYYAQHTPDAPAFLYADTEMEVSAKICTYGEAYDWICTRADEFKASQKTSIGILADGSLECVITTFAANKAGLQVVMLDQTMPVHIVKKLLSFTDVDTVYGEQKRVNEIKDSQTEKGIDGTDKTIFFTSGTTSEAKAVTLTGHSLCQSAYNGGSMLPLCASDILLCVLPLGHVFGFVCGLLWGLSAGGIVALGRGARHYQDDLEYFKPTVISVVPTLLDFYIKHNLFNIELKRVLIGAGDCPIGLITAVKNLGIAVYNGYGLTETSSGVAISTGEDPYAMEVCPDDRITVAEDGEILINAPTCMMSGYYKRPEDTAMVLIDGILHTGDLGRYDEQGRLHIIGRKKEILVLGDGMKIFLPEYENAIANVLETKEIAVILRNQKPCLLYYGSLDRDAIWKKLKPVMEEYPRSKQLADIIITNMPMPRTASGKIKRSNLEQMIYRNGRGDAI